MERTRQYLDDIRIKAAACVAAGSMLLGLAGCSFGERQEEHVPEDTATYVVDDAVDYEYVDMGDITDAIAAQDSTKPSYEMLENIDPKTNKDTYDFPLFMTSAPVLTVTLGKDSKLQYQDATPGLLLSEQILLSAVKKNEPFLSASMEAGYVDSLRFRSFRPSVGSEEQDATMFYLPKDYTDGGKSNMYYFLPAEGQVNTESIDDMLGHEAAHSVLGHDDQNVLSAQDRSEYQAACKVLRTSALQDTERYSSAAYDLAVLRDDAPKKLKPAYTTVINALEDGTYGDLAVRETWQTEIKDCYIQTPVNAVGKQAEVRGVMDILSGYTEDDAIQEQNERIFDDWSNIVEDFTVYKSVTESNWMSPSLANEDSGHPQEGWHEVAASSLNRLMKDPEGFAKDIANEDEEEKAAFRGILTTDISILKTVYPNRSDLHQLVDGQLAVFDAALNG